MSEVWAAEDLELGRRVAVKLLAGDADPARFEREAHAVAALAHPNICQLYDYGEEKGRPYMVLEYLGGGTLEDRLVVRDVEAAVVVWADVVFLAVVVACSDVVLRAFVLAFVDCPVRVWCEVVGCDAFDERVARTASATPVAASTSTAAMTRGSVARDLVGERCLRITTVGSPPAISVGAAGIVVAPLGRAWTSAVPSAGRSAGSFAIEAIATAASVGGASPRASPTGSGCSLMCMRASSSGLSLSNGSRPVSIR